MKIKRAVLFFCLLTSVASALAQTQSYKRGVCVDNGKFSLADLKSLSTGVSWFYNWGTTTATPFVDDNMIYVPMAWTANYDKAGLRSFLQSHPEVKYLLGFNEPNFKHQANLTPSQAAAAWKGLEEIADEFDLKLVSPAPNWCGDCVQENGTTYNDPYKYIEDFLAACPDCRVDFIGVHFYMGNLGAVKGSLEKLYNQFQKPIWFTEFNMDANGMGQNGTPDDQRKFMVEVLDYLEQADYVYRYSWFLARGGIVADLLTSPYGTLSDLGMVYTHMSSYDDDFYHNVNTRIEAEHYIKMNEISLVVSTDVSGNISVGYVGEGSWVEYNVDVPAAGTYDLNMRVTSNEASVVECYADGQKLSEFNLEATGGWMNWQTVTNPVELKAGKQKIRLLFKLGGSDINWLSIGDLNETGLRETVASSVSLYPNPVRDIVTVESPVALDAYSVYDLQGSKLMEGHLGQEQNIDLSELAAGHYVLQVFASEGQLLTSKIFNKQ